jgi:hypothetical protein
LSGGYVLDHLQGICAKVRENLADEEKLGEKFALICLYYRWLGVVLEFFSRPYLGEYFCLEK